jgi:cell division protein FtsA
VGITGSHVKSALSMGEHMVESADGRITDEDREDALKNALDCRPREMSNNSLVLHRIKQPFLVDGKPEESGYNATARILTLPLYWIYANRAQTNIPIKILQNLSLEPKYPVFNGFAAAMVLMDAEQRQKGGLIIDLGAGTTEYVYIHRGSIRYAGSLSIGGDHVSNDLALGLKLEIGVAENLKTVWGRAICDPQAKGAMMPFEPSEGERGKVRFDHFQLIMELRLKEIFQIIRENLAEAKIHLAPDQGVVLCGGGACIQMISSLASSVFQAQSWPYRLNHLDGFVDALKKPQLVTPIGLARYCASKVSRKTGAPLANIFNFRRFSGKRKDTE